MRPSRSPAIALLLISSIAPSQTPAQRSTQPAPSAHPAYPTGISTPLGTQITALLTDPAVSRAHWGIAITTLDGTPLYGLDEAKLFRPASTAKLFTTAAAMDLLGPEEETTTTASFDKPSADGVTKHDLHVFTGGAGYLSALPAKYNSPAAALDAALPDPLQQIDELAQKIAATGLKKIDGDVLWTDQNWGERYPEGWSKEDTVWGYGAPVSTISINDNELQLKLTPQEKASPQSWQTATAALSPDVGYYKISVQHLGIGLAQEPTLLGIEHLDPDTLNVFGRIPAPTAETPAPYTTQIAIDDPARFAAEALVLKLKQYGVEVSGVAKADHLVQGAATDFLKQTRAWMYVWMPGNPGGDLMGYGTAQGDCGVGPCPVSVTQTLTISRDADIAYTLKTSQNLHAEMLLHQIAEKLHVGRTAVDGAHVVHQWLTNIGIDPDDFVFYDGSGLSVKDLVTPRATAQLLAYAAKQPWFPTWKAALPIGGIDGTLSGRFKTPPLKAHIFAKTGTLGESRALSGYLDAASGRTLIFSILVDNHTPGSSADRTTMDKIVAAIAAAN